MRTIIIVVLVALAGWWFWSNGYIAKLEEAAKAVQAPGTPSE
jgi:hypothetical protein